MTSLEYFRSVFVLTLFLSTSSFMSLVNVYIIVVYFLGYLFFGTISSQLFKCDVFIDDSSIIILNTVVLPCHVSYIFFLCQVYSLGQASSPSSRYH